MEVQASQSAHLKWWTKEIPHQIWKTFQNKSRRNSGNLRLSNFIYHYISETASHPNSPASAHFPSFPQSFQLLLPWFQLGKVFWCEPTVILASYALHMMAGLGGPTRKLLVVAAQLITKVLDFKLQHHVLWVWFRGRHASAVWNEMKRDETVCVYRTELY